MTISLVRAEAPLTTGGLRMDPVTEKVLTAFDAQDTSTDFYPWVIEGVLPDEWSIGLIVGASGTGKSTLLSSLGSVVLPEWVDDLPVAGHFGSPEDAIDRLGAVGLGAVPTWAKPYRVLSTGEKFRVDLARQIGNDALIDEYTSTVSRTVAKSASRALRKWADRNNTRRMVLATCHFDVADWLQPDWIINTDVGTFSQGEQSVEKWWLEFTTREEGHIRCTTSMSPSID